MTYYVRRDMSGFWHIYDPQGRSVMCWIWSHEDAIRWKYVLDEMFRVIQSQQQKLI